MEGNKGATVIFFKAYKYSKTVFIMLLFKYGISVSTIEILYYVNFISNEKQLCYMLTFDELTYFISHKLCFLNNTNITAVATLQIGTGLSHYAYFSDPL